LQKSSGTTYGQVSQCSASTYAQFLSLPELAGVPANMLFCPPIDFAQEIQTGDVEVYVSACNATTSKVICASDYRQFKFFDTQVITTGVFHNKLVVDNDAYSFVPEVTVTNKFTIDNEHTIHQDSFIVRNDMGTKSFFTYDTNYPYYALAPSATQTDLLFK